MTEGFITVPNTTFFTDNIVLINNITSIVKDIIAPIFIIYFTFVIVRTYFGGNISDLPMSFWRFFCIALTILYFYPIFVGIYNGFSSVGNGIFNISNLDLLNDIDLKLQYFAANPSAPDTPHTYGPLGATGVGSIFHARGIEYWFIRFEFFIAHVSYVAVFFVRQVILLLSLCILPYLLTFSFWETARNKAIGLVTMMVEIMFWYPVFCICMALIFKINTPQGASNWLVGVHSGLSGFFEEKGPGYMLGEIMFKIALVIVATWLTPAITNMIFNGRAVYASGLVAAPLYAAGRSISRQASRLTNAVISAKSAKLSSKVALGGLAHGANTLSTAASNTGQFMKNPSAGSAAKVALSPIHALKYSCPNFYNSFKGNANSNTSNKKG